MLGRIVRSKHLLSSLIFALLLASSAAAVNWGSFKVFSGTAPPYAANGPGCKGPFSPPAQLSVGEKCPNNESVYDLGAVWVDRADGFIAWKVVAPNLTDLQACGGTKGSGMGGWAVAVEFNSDNNFSTGCQGMQGYPCYPGSEFRVWVYGDGSASFEEFNQSLVGTTCQANNDSATDCFSTLQGALYNVSVNISCGTPGVVMFAVNESALPNLKGMNFETNSFYLGQPPADQLGAYSGGSFSDKIVLGGPKDYMFEDMHPCTQYDFTNKTACENNTNNVTGADKCVWRDFEKVCDPDFSQMTCSEFCGACNSTSACLTGAKGKCMAVDAPPILPPDAKTWNDNGAKICVEDFSKVDLSGKGSCDEDCRFCYTNETCSNSAYPDPTGMGAGCKWVKDPYFGDEWCDYSTFDESALQCGPGNLNRCFDQASCTGAGGNWSSALNVCYNYDNTTEYLCFDGEDNDNDGLLDCFDPDCSKDPFCGGDVDVLTGGYGTLDPLEAMKKDLFSDMDQGPPVELGSDPDDGLPGEIDIVGFGMKDMGKAFGLGIMVKDLRSTSLLCNGSKTSKYTYLLDVDANASNGCSANLSGTIHSGFEYRFDYYILNNGSGEPLEVRKGFRCINGSFALYPAKLSGAPPDPFINEPVSCEAGAAILAVAKKDIGNPTSTLRLMAAAYEENASAETANDTITGGNGEGVYYTPGAVDFKPKDCFENPLACGTAFSLVGQGKFMPFEDCFTGTGDEDLDGLSNCDDPDCRMVPWCQGNYNASSDKEAPTVLGHSAEVFDDFVFLHWFTNEPTNATVTFHSACSNGTAIYTFNDLGDLLFSTDDFKPWHDLGIKNQDKDSNGAVVGINPSTTYYYRIKSCDAAGNCAVSACLNFTTTTAAQNLQIKFDFVPPPDPLINQTILKLWNGSSYEDLNFSTPVNKSSYLVNASVKFENPYSGWEIEFKGVEIAKAVNFNLSSSLNVTNKSGKTYVGLGNQEWQDMSQNLGVDSVIIVIPESGNKLIKCNEHNLSDCSDVTSQATLLSSTPYNSTWKIPVSLGFSTYTVQGTGEVYNLTFQNQSSMNVSVWEGQNASFNVLLTNENNVTRVYNLSVNFIGASATYFLNVTQVNLSNGSSESVNVKIYSATNGSYTWELVATQYQNSSITLNSTPDIGYFTAVFKPNYDLVFTNTTAMSQQVSTGSNAQFKVSIKNNGRANATYNFTASASSGANIGVNVSQAQIAVNQTVSVLITMNSSSAGTYKGVLLAVLANNSSIIFNSSVELGASFQVTVTSSSPTTSTTTTSGGGGGGAASMDSATFVFTKVEEGELKEYNINRLKLPVKKVSFKAVQGKKGYMKVEVAKTYTLPAGVPRISGAHSYFEVRFTNVPSSYFADGVIEFEVETSWLKENGLNAGDVKLYRYTEEWTPLPTIVKEEALKKVRYTAATPGFSYFAIAPAKEEKEEAAREEGGQGGAEQEQQQGEEEGTPLKKEGSGEEQGAGAKPEQEAKNESPPQKSKGSKVVEWVVFVAALLAIALILYFYASKHKKEY